jgi:general secretion pathway protein K
MSLPRQSLFLRSARTASILIITVWTLCLLSVFGLYLSRGVRQKLSLIRTLSFRNSLHFIADAGFKKAVVELIKDEEISDSLGESWSNNPSVFQGVSVGDGSFSVSYFYRDRDNNLKERFGIVDEERKVNINKAKLSTIQNIIQFVAGLDESEAKEIAASIVDWRDGDSFLSIPIGSAEDSYYNNISEPYDCKDSDFEVLEELLLVKGVSEDVFASIKDFVTIYGAGAVNINTASPQVLLALGLREEIVDKIMTFRAGDDEVEASGDDNVFLAPSSIVPQLSEFVSLSDVPAPMLSNAVAQGALVTASYNFMVTSKARAGRFSKEIVCIVNKKGAVLRWFEL